MKIYFSLLLLIPSFIFSQTKGVNFIKNLSWNEVKAKAEKEKKYIFIDVYASWCGPCKKMDKSTYSDDTLGTYVNNNFISIKLQVDSTITDDSSVRNWYADAQKLKQQYSISAYPTYLFLTPEAELIYKDIGYKPVSEFWALANKALDKKNVLFYENLKNYKAGQKDYTIMPDLAIKVKELLGDKLLAKQISEDYIQNTEHSNLLSIDKIYLVRYIAENKDLSYSLAKEYKELYLDKLTDSQLCKKEIIWFMNLYSDLINSKDNFFRLCYFDPEKVNAEMGMRIAENLVNTTISNEEIKNKLIKNKKLMVNKPDWDKYLINIENKYPRVNARKLMLDFQVAYYRRLDLNWKLWAHYQEQRINNDTLKSGDGFWKLNMPAWDAFLHCNDRTVLIKALKWSTKSINIDAPNINPQCYDTKANLLYKLGMIKKAINEEQRAIELSNQIAKTRGKLKGALIDDYLNALRQMKNEKPTYLNAGAVWNNETLPSKAMN
jgi:thioredoxin-related protein